MASHKHTFAKTYNGLFHLEITHNEMLGHAFRQRRGVYGINCERKGTALCVGCERKGAEQNKSWLLVWMLQLIRT